MDKTHRYPGAIRAVLATPDPGAVLALLQGSPDPDVRGRLRVLGRRPGQAALLAAVTTMRWRYGGGPD